MMLFLRLLLGTSFFEADLFCELSLARFCFRLPAGFLFGLKSHCFFS